MGKFKDCFKEISKVLRGGFVLFGTHCSFPSGRRSFFLTILWRVRICSLWLDILDMQGHLDFEEKVQIPPNGETRAGILHPHSLIHEKYWIWRENMSVYFKSWKPQMARQEVVLCSMGLIWIHIQKIFLKAASVFYSVLACQYRTVISDETVFIKLQVIIH